MATLIDKVADYGVPKTHMHYMKILLSRQKLVFGVQCFEAQYSVLCYLNRQLSKNYPNFFTHLISVLEEKELDSWFQVPGLPTLQKQQELSCKTSLVTALSGVVFGHHGPQPYAT